MEDRGMPTERERYLQEKQGYFTNGQWPATCDGGTLTDDRRNLRNYTEDVGT